jgi:hypothetical protein
MIDWDGNIDKQTSPTEINHDGKVFSRIIKNIFFNVDATLSILDTNNTRIDTDVVAMTTYTDENEITYNLDTKYMYIKESAGEIKV